MKVSTIFHDSELVGSEFISGGNGNDYRLSFDSICSIGPSITYLTFQGVATTFSMESRPRMWVGEFYCYESYDEAAEIVEAMAALHSANLESYIDPERIRSSIRLTFSEYFKDGYLIFHLEGVSSMGELVVAKGIESPLGLQEIWSETWLPYEGC